jgi:Ser/Thr protein kinase RdoA (MazF antagonist)
MSEPNRISLTPEAGIPELLSGYDLAPPVAWALLAAGCNEVHRVTTGSGRFVLKLYRAGWRTRDEVLAEVEVLFHLAHKGLSVALPVAARGGAFVRSLPAHKGERPAVLFTHAPGVPFTAEDEHRSALFGRTLADLHNATDDLQAAPMRWDLAHLLDFPLRALEPLMEHRAEDWRYLNGLARRLRERLARLPESSCQWGFCHGDFRPANAHFDVDAELFTLFDLEMCGIGLRAYDLATFRFFLTSAGEEARQEAHWQAFLSGYAGRRALDAADRCALPWFVPLRPIRILGNIFQTAQKNRDLEPWRPSEHPHVRLPTFVDGMLSFLRAWDAAHLSAG